MRSLILALLLLTVAGCRARDSSTLESDTNCQIGGDPLVGTLDGSEPSASDLTQQFKIQPMSAELAQQVFPLVKSSYEKVGGAIYASAEVLRQRTNFGVTVEKNGKVIVFAGGKSNQFGNKVAVIATDGTPESSRDVKVLIQNVGEGKFPGTYAEVSGAPLFIASMSRDRLKMVPLDKAKIVMGPQVLRQPTETELSAAVKCKEIPDKPEIQKNAYVRLIDFVKGYHTKVLIGVPNGI